MSLVRVSTGSPVKLSTVNLVGTVAMRRAQHEHRKYGQKGNPSTAHTLNPKRSGLIIVSRGQNETGASAKGALWIPLVNIAFALPCTPRGCHPVKSCLKGCTVASTAATPLGSAGLQKMCNHSQSKNTATDIQQQRQEQHARTRNNNAPKQNHNNSRQIKCMAVYRHCWHQQHGRTLSAHVRHAQHPINQTNQSCHPALHTVVEYIQSICGC